MLLKKTIIAGQNAVGNWISAVTGDKMKEREGLFFVSEDPERGHFTSHGVLMVKNEGLKLKETHREQLERVLKTCLPDLSCIHITKEGFMNISMNEQWVKSYLLEEKTPAEMLNIHSCWRDRLHWLYQYHWDEGELKGQDLRINSEEKPTLRKGLWAIMKDEQQGEAEGPSCGGRYEQWLGEFEKKVMIGRVSGTEKNFVMHLYYAGMKRYQGGSPWTGWE